MRGRHCPFLNRNDARCGEHFRVDQLRHAFTHCFNAYERCPSYRQLLSERNESIREAMNDDGHRQPSPTPVVTLTIQGRHAATFRQLRHCGHLPANAA